MLEVKNRGEVPAAALAELDKGHLQVIAYAGQGTGVVSGGVLSPGTGRTINVSAVNARRGTNVVVGAAVTNLAIAAPDTTFARWDLVTIDEGNVIAVTTGIAEQEPTLPAIPADKVVLGAVYVTPIDTASIPAAQIQQLQAPLQDAPRFDGELIHRQNILKWTVYGHSLAEGGVVSSYERSLVSHLSTMWPIQLKMRALGGAVVGWNQNNVVGDGGYAAVAQNEYRPVRPAARLTAQANAGALSLTVDTIAGMQVGDIVHVGTGDTGATGGETVYISALPGTITLKTALVRTHLNGEPVYVTPASVQSPAPLYMAYYGINDLGAYPITSIRAADPNLRRRFTDALEYVVARIRVGEMYENDSAAHTYTGTWFAAISANGSNSGNGARQPQLVNAAVEYPVADNFEGGEVDVFFIVGPHAGTPPVWTIEVDGVTHGTLTCTQHTSGKLRGAVYRITGLAPGRHRVKATITTLGNGATYFDGIGIVPLEPPLVVIPGANRPYSYETYNTWVNGPKTPTLTGTHGVGTTSWTISSTTGMLAGQTFTPEEGTANAESLEIASVTDATHVVTTTASTISHAGGVTIKVGVQDADVPVLNAMIQAICTAFGDRVLFYDTDTVLGKNPAYFWSDGGHFNDRGHVALVEGLWETIQASTGLTPGLMARSAPAVPFGANGNSHTIYGGAGGIWTNQPAAETEFLGAAAGRIPVDLSNAEDIEFWGNVTTAGAAAAKLFLMYTTDLTGATGWTYMGRDYSFSPTATASRDVCSIALASTGLKTSGVIQIPPAAQRRVLIRLMGVGGDATADPAFGTIGFTVY